MSCENKYEQKVDKILKRYYSQIPNSVFNVSEYEIKRMMFSGVEERSNRRSKEEMYQIVYELLHRAYADGMAKGRAESLVQWNITRDMKKDGL